MLRNRAASAIACGTFASECWGQVDRKEASADRGAAGLASWVDLTENVGGDIDV